MIRVRVRVEDVANRLVGEQLLRLVDVQLAARDRLTGFEHHHVVLELDEQRVVAARTSRQSIESVAELLRGDGERWWRTAATRATGRRAAAGAAATRRRWRRLRQ